MPAKTQGGQQWRPKAPLLRLIDRSGHEREFVAGSGRESTGRNYELLVRGILCGQNADLKLDDASRTDVARLRGCKQKLATYCQEWSMGIFAQRSVEDRPLGEQGLEIDAIFEGTLAALRQYFEKIGKEFVPDQDISSKGQHVLVECTSDSMLFPAKLLQIEAQVELVKKGGCLCPKGEEFTIQPNQATISFAIVYNRQRLNISKALLENIARCCGLCHVQQLLREGRLLVFYFCSDESVGRLVSHVQELEKSQIKLKQEFEEQRKQDQDKLRELEEQRKQDEEQRKQDQDKLRKLEELVQQLVAKQAGRAVFLFCEVVQS